MILIRDSNKVVYRAVLQSPRLSDTEIESFAAMKNVADEVLRIIASTRKFAKNYAVVRNLATKPPHTAGCFPSLPESPHQQGPEVSQHEPPRRRNPPHHGRQAPHETHHRPAKNSEL